MVAQTMEICLSAISSVFNIMHQIFESLGAWSYVLGAIIIFTIFRLLIRPVMGSMVSSGASDTVRALKGGKRSDSASNSSKGEKK